MATKIVFHPPASSLPRKPRRMLERPPLSCLGDWPIPLFHLDARAAPTTVRILW